MKKKSESIVAKFKKEDKKDDAKLMKKLKKEVKGKKK